MRVALAWLKAKLRPNNDRTKINKLYLEFCEAPSALRFNTPKA